jgi:hypothetical protein
VAHFVEELEKRLRLVDASVARLKDDIRPMFGASSF